MHQRWVGGVHDTFVQLFMPYLNFEYTKAVAYALENVGGGIGQDPATEVTHLVLNKYPLKDTSRDNSEM